MDYFKTKKTLRDHLVELTKTMDKDEFAIIAISNESPARIQPFVKMTKMDYTVTSIQQPLPAPYRYVNAIPSSCFIDKQGNIKLATAGIVPIDDIKAILKAPR